VSYYSDALKLEVVSKSQIRPEGKAQADEKAQHTREYVSIMRRFATPPHGLRWGFETTSELHKQLRPHVSSWKILILTLN